MLARDKNGPGSHVSRGKASSGVTLAIRVVVVAGIVAVLHFWFTKSRSSDREASGAASPVPGQTTGAVAEGADQLGPELAEAMAKRKFHSLTLQQKMAIADYHLGIQEKEGLPLAAKMAQNTGNPDEAAKYADKLNALFHKDPFNDLELICPDTIRADGEEKKYAGYLEWLERRRQRKDALIEKLNATIRSGN